LPQLSSLRVKLIIAAIVVQALMLAAIIAKGIDVMSAQLEDRAQLQLVEDKKLLVTSLAVPLKRHDIPAIEAVLAQARSNDNIAYLVVFDAAGNVVARSGWDAAVPLPPLSAQLHDAASLKRGRFDSEVKIQLNDEVVGNVRFGLATAFLQTARADLMRQALAIGGTAMAVSALLIAMVGIWLTRNLNQLTRASERVAEGNFTVRLPVESNDEIGRLTAGFNVMSEALRNRIEALAASEAKFHAIADHSYDVERSWHRKQADLDQSARLRHVRLYPGRMPCDGELRPRSSIRDVSRTIRQIRQRCAALRAGFEFRAQRQDGSLLWGAADWRPIYGGNKDYLGIRIAFAT
jgi:HAMP domain-containing protein